jgi:hypothetical protein
MGCSITHTHRHVHICTQTHALTDAHNIIAHNTCRYTPMQAQHTDTHTTYARTLTCANTCTHTHTHIHAHTHAHTTYEHIHTYTWTHTHGRAQTRKHMQIHIHMHTSVQIMHATQTHLHMHTHACTHTHRHAYTQHTHTQYKRIIKHPLDTLTSYKTWYRIIKLSIRGDNCHYLVEIAVYCIGRVVSLNATSH